MFDLYIYHILAPVIG